MSGATLADLPLLPRPRHLERRDGPANLRLTPELQPDPSLRPEGYEVVLDHRALSIRHADAAGLRHATGLIEQLRRVGRPLPALQVRDWPDFPVRGYMLDVSRDRVPTRTTLVRIVGLLGLLRINQLQLYTEHTFAYAGHEEVWRDASPMTAEDIRWLDGLCREHGVELVANQNCFGHMERWLRHAAYRDRAEAPDGWTAPWGGRRRPAVLEPTEENARFALGLVRELMGCHSSRSVNIGCDETFELGLGRSRELVDARGRERVYLDHLLRLLEGLHADGFDVQFWGDILRADPGLVSELPKERTTALAWHYEAPLDVAEIPEALRGILADFGFPEETLRGFDGQVKPFAASGTPYWVCPGTSSWNTLVGRLPNARANLLDAAEVGLANGARGYLITDWGDNGHLQPPSVSFAPLALGAAYAWCLDANRDLDLATGLDRHVFRDDAGRLGGALETIGEVYRNTGKRSFNASPLFTDLLQGGLLGSMGDADEAALARVTEELEDASARIGRAAPRCEDGAIVTRELQQAIRLARHGAWRMARAAGFSAPGDDEMRRDLAEAIAEQRACWLERSRPGGLEDSVARLEKTLASYG